MKGGNYVPALFVYLVYPQARKNVIFGGALPDELAIIFRFTEGRLHWEPLRNC